MLYEINIKEYVGQAVPDNNIKLKKRWTDFSIHLSLKLESGSEIP